MRKLVLFISIVLLGCEPDPIPINIDQNEPTIVVTTQYFPDVGLVLLLTKSFGALEDRDIEQGDGDLSELEILQDLLISDAQIRLSSGNVSKTLQPLGFGFYAIDLLDISNGSELNLEIYDPSTGKITRAKTTSMSVPTIESVGYSFSYEADDTLTHVSFEIDDPPGDNWYLVNVYSEVIDQPDYRRGLTQFEWLSSQSMLIAPNQNLKDSISLRNWPKDSLGVAVFNLTPDHYRYLDELIKSEQAIPFITEPLNISGNIEAGFGYFGASFPAIEFISVTK